MKLGFYVYYHIGLLLLGILFVSVFLMSHYNVYGFSETVLQMVALFFGATFGAYLTSRTYDYISRSSQEREWRRSVQLATWEDVYLPIYQALVRDLPTVERYGYQGIEPWHSGDFPEKETLLEVVNPEFLKKARNYISLRDEYQKALREFDDDVQGLVSAYHQNMFPNDRVDTLNVVLFNNRLFLAGRAPLIPEEDRKSYATAYNTLKKSYPDLAEDPSTTIDILTDKVRSSPKTQYFLSTHSLFIETTKDLLEATKEVIQKPYRI